MPELIEGLLARPEFPRASQYDARWILDNQVDVQVADTLPEGWKMWLQWKRARLAAGDTSPGLESDIQVLESDAGRYMGFVRMVART